MQTKLAIAIPTYNRAEILQFNLLQIIDELIEFQIPVYISDDSTNEDTYIVINDLKKKHSLFYYRKNEIRFGHDLNCLNTISFPKEQYVWYMGDSMIIKKGAIKKIISLNEIEEYDFITCNAEGRNLDMESRVFYNGKEVFENLCWHLTMTGAAIYNKKSLINLINFDTSKFKNFPQTAIIFEQFAVKKSSLYWINDRLIYSNSNKNSYWASKVFEVFIDDFRSFLNNLSTSYSLKSKEEVLLQHSLKTGIFSFHSFVLYRIGGFYNYKIFKKYKDIFKKITRTNIIILIILSVFWIKPLSGIYLFVKKITKVNHN
jgi:hypothetical protein